MAMRRKKTSRHVYIVPIAVLVTILTPWNLFAQLAQGRTTGTDPAARLAEVLDSYVNAVRALPEDVPDQQEIPARERVVRVATLMTPPPAVPPEAERFVVRGNTTLQTGTDVETLRAAAQEFRRALRAAPWFGAALYGLAVVEGNRGEYDVAIANLNLYVLTNPADALQARSRIAEFESRRGQPVRVAVPVAAATPPPPTVPASQPPPTAPPPPARAAAPASQPPAGVPLAAPKTPSSGPNGKKIFFVIGGAGLMGAGLLMVKPYISHFEDFPNNRLIPSAVMVGAGAAMFIGGVALSVSPLPGGIAVGGHIGIGRPRTLRQ